MTDPSFEALSNRFGAMPWKELIKNIDAGISQMLYYCESNQDWLKAIEANELLQSKLSSFASLLGKFAAGSLDSPNQRTTGPMFGIPKAQPHPLSLGVGAPPSHPSSFDGGLPQAPGLIPSQQVLYFVSLPFSPAENNSFFVFFCSPQCLFPRFRLHRR
jgi:hypothetical protein